MRFGQLQLLSEDDQTKAHDFCNADAQTAGGPWISWP